MFGQRGDAPGDVGLLVRIHIAHAIAAAEVERLCRITELFFQFTHEGQHQVDGVLKDRLVEDHRAHMAVQTVECHVRHAQSGAHKVQRLAGADGDAELHIHASGVHRLIGMRVDAGGDAQQDLLPHAACSRLAVERFQFLIAVHHEAAHAMVEGIADIGVGLAVAMEPDQFRRESRLERGVDLAAGHAVDTHALLFHDAVHLFEGTGFACVKGQGALPEGCAEGVFIHAAVEADAVFVHEVEGRSAAFGQRRDGLVCKEQRTVRAARDV